MATFFSSKTSNNATAFTNGRVYTIDTERPWASGFIVSADGVFELVGDDAYIRNIASSRGIVIVDLQQRFVMPGIHDAHTHLMSAGDQALWQVKLDPNTTNEENIASRLQTNACRCKYSNVVGDWVVGNYYFPWLFPDGKPDRMYLDQAFPATPVIIREQSSHKILVNTEGLRRLGLDPITAQPPPGGIFVRREDGSMTGEMMESATGIAWTSLPVPPLTMVKNSLEHSIALCHKYGITSVQEASANTVYLHALRELEEENRLNLDVSAHIVYGNESFGCESHKSLEALLEVAEAFRSKHVRTNFVKFWLDGSPIEPNSTHCSLDETGVADSRMLLFQNEDLLSAVLKYDAKGMTCKMHAAGEGSIRQALDVYEQVRAQNPNGPWHEVAHSNAIHNDDLPRLASLRVIAEMSPAIFHIADTFPQVGQALRYEFDAVHSHGGKITVGTDWPVTETPNLLPAVAELVRKRISVDPSGDQNTNKDEPPEERSGRITCRLMTLGAAEALGQQSRTGSVSVGKKANFVAFDRDLSRGEFEGASVLATWFEGRLVYSAEGW